MPPRSAEEVALNAILASPRPTSRRILCRGLAVVAAVALLLGLGRAGLSLDLEGRRIPALFASHGLAIDDTDRRLFMVSEYDSVAEVDLATNRFVRAFSVGSGARLSSGLAHVAGKLYVVASDRTVVLDAETDAELAVLPHPTALGLSKGEAVVSSDRSLVYTVIGSSTSISVIDVASDTVVGTVRLGKDFVSLALSPAGERVYAVNPETSELAIIDTRSLSLERRVGFAFDGEGALDIVPQISVGPSGQVFVAYVAPGYRGRIAVLSPSGDAMQTFVLPGYSTGVACSPDGRHLATGAGYVLDASDGSLLDHVPTPFVGLYHVVFNHEGDRAFISNDNDRFLSVIEGFHEVPTQIELEGAVRVGETLEIYLDFPGETGAPFQIAASASVDRGIPLGSAGLFPLDNDTLLRLTLDPLTRECVGFKGFLGPNGRAVAQFRSSHHAPGVPAGTTIYLAAVTFDGSLTRDSVRTISNVASIVVE
jgi:DNA-binding beta-propeller fold protein YncE